MRRFYVWTFVLLIASAASFLVGWLIAARAAEQREGGLLGVAWGDGKYGPAFYGAYVFLEETPNGYSVRARVRIGPGSDYFHDCGEIGTARSFEEAVRRFGSIRWQEDGLHIGSQGAAYFLERARIEAHR